VTKFAHGFSDFPLCGTALQSNGSHRRYDRAVPNLATPASRQSFNV
jgi:hypothetical protein